MNALIARRELLLAAGGSVAAALTVPAVPALAQGDGGPDADFLREAIKLEQINAEAYQRSAPELGGIARLFRSHERTHADSLAAELRRLGGGSAPFADVDAALAGQSDASGRRAVAQYLLDLEDKAVATYVKAHGTIRDARLMAVVSQILGNQAQHLVALRTITGQPEVPTAFETGRA